MDKFYIYINERETEKQKVNVFEAQKNLYEIAGLPKIIMLNMYIDIMQYKHYVGTFIAMKSFFIHAKYQTNNLI